MTPEKTVTIKVTENIYKICCVLAILEDLRIFGMVVGGLRVNRDNLRTIIKKGVQLGYNRPTGHEAELIIYQLQRIAQREEHGT